jgi:hypothetical protein
VRRPGSANIRAAHGSRGADDVAGVAEHFGPSEQVVRDGGDHRPGAVGVKVPGREVRQGLVFEVADDELDDGVLAMLGLDDRDRFGAVGRPREVPSVRKQLGLGRRGGCGAQSAAGRP